MRNVVHAARLLVSRFCLASAALAGDPAAAEAPRDRHARTPTIPASTTRPSRTSTSTPARRPASDGDQCRAFTYNTKARWCFLKTDFGTLTATPGATAGRARADRRADPEPRGDPPRRSSTSSPAAMSTRPASSPVRSSVASRRRPTAPTRRSATRAPQAYNAGNYDEAAALFGQTPGRRRRQSRPLARLRHRQPRPQSRRLVRAPGRPIATSPRRASTASSAPTTSDNQAKALAMMGDGFAAPRGMEALLSLLSRQPRAGRRRLVRTDYDQVIAEHGFRIVSHTVDADVADPRICIVFSDDLPVSDPRLSRLRHRLGRRGPRDRARAAARSASTASSMAAATTSASAAGCRPPTARCSPSPAELDVYVRDRAPWVGFAGNAYVLPAGPGASIPIVSVNTDKALAAIYRIGDRGVAYADPQQPVPAARSPHGAPSNDRRRERREGLGRRDPHLSRELNKTITTAVPISDAVPDMKPGVYVITAKAELDPDEWGQLATQWFVVSDLGLTALSGSDGIHAIVRSLSTAEPVAGAKLRLVAVNNDVLGEATTDAERLCPLRPGPRPRHRRRGAADDRRNRSPTATMPSSTSPAPPSTSPTAASTAVRRRARSTSSSRPSAASTGRARPSTSPRSSATRARSPSPTCR